MSAGTSRPVDPDTGRPRDFDDPYADLDLPPRKSRPGVIRVLSSTEYGPYWPLKVRTHAYLVGVAISALGTLLADLTSNDASIGMAIVLAVPGAIAAAGVAFAADAAVKRSPLYRVETDDPLARDLEVSHAAAVEAWRASRPLVWLARQDNPLPALRELMAAHQGSLVVGVVPDTQELYTIKREQPLLVMASGQLGKTTGLAIPMVLAHQGAAVVTSTKDDLLKATSAVRASRGDVWIFDPAGSWTDRMPPEANAAYWTPLWSSYTWEGARLSAEAMIRATAMGQGERNFHWRQTAKMYLAPSLLAAALQPGLEMTDVFEWVADRDFEVPSAILWHISGDPSHPRQLDAKLAWRSMRAMLRTEGEHRDSILTTLMTLLDAYNSKHYDVHRGRQNFDPAAFVRSTDTVYIASRSREQQDFAPVIVAFIDAIQQAAYDYETEAPFHASQRPSLLMCLDEVANVAPMRDLPRYLSEAGGQGVQIVAFIQSLTQVEDVWPNHVKGFFNFFLNIAAFGGFSDDQTTSALSKLSGDYDRKYVSNSFSITNSQGVSNSRSSSFLNPVTYTSGDNEGISTSMGQNTSFHKERRLTEADIATLPPGHALVISKKERNYRNRGFTILEMVPSYEEPWTRVCAAVPKLLPSRRTFPNQFRPVHNTPSTRQMVRNYREAQRAARAEDEYDDE